MIPAALIAPFFDDLTFAGGGRVSSLLTGSVGSRRFVVQWSNASILDSVGNDLGADMTFELILFEGSNDIQFVYQSMTGERSDGSSATIGLQNLQRSDAVQAGFNQAIVGNGVAITYRFGGGTYIEDVGNQTTPTAPTVSDGGGADSEPRRVVRILVDGSRGLDPALRVYHRDDARWCGCSAVYRNREQLRRRKRTGSG